MTTTIEEYIERIPLFHVCSAEERAQLAAGFERAVYRMGETIIRQGDRSTAFYIVASGQARKIGVSATGEERNLGLLGGGEHFGEQSLLRDEPAAATVAASTELETLKLEREAFARLIAGHAGLKRYFEDYLAYDAMRIFLQKDTVLSHLDAGAIRSLLDSFTVREYEQGETLVREGDPGDSFYILRTGSASVLQGDERRLLNRLLPGDYFGELALLTGATRKASVVAEETCTVFRLEKEAFEGLIVRYPKVRQTMERIASYYSEAPLVMVEELQQPVLQADEGHGQGVADTGVAASSTLASRGIRNGVRQLWSRRYPALLQQSEMDCGPACLTMIVRYYGGKISLNRMRKRTAISTSGTTLQGLVETASELGFQATGMHTGIADMAGFRTPSVLHWNGNHYIVLYKVQGNQAFIVDPAVGVVETVALDVLREKWTGVALLLEPDLGQVRRIRDEERLMETFLPFLKPFHRALAGIALLAVLLQLALLTIPIVTQVIVDRVLVGRSQALLELLLIGLLGLSVLQLAGTYARQLLVSRTAMKLDLALVGAFYRKLFDLPYDYFVKRTTGDVLTRAQESEKIRRLLTDHAVYLLLDGLALLIYGTVMFVYNVKLALLTLAFLPLFVLLVAIVLPRLRRISRKEFIAEGDSQSALVEAVHAVATVKALAAEPIARGKLEEKLAALLTLRKTGVRLEAAADAGSRFLQVLGNVLLLYWGSRFVLGGGMTVGALVAFNGLYLIVIQAVDSITRMLDQVSEARISMERLNDVFEAEEEQPDPGRMRLLPPLRGHIRFDNVAFRYEPGGRNVLANLTFEIMPGQTVALVGRSGSGKTTFIQLLLKLFVPSDGTIILDGYDLRQVHTHSLRRQIGVVQQETVVFRGSIRDNISYHHPAASDEEIRHAAMLAGAHEFISSFPLGYQTVIGEGGMRLSGGQRQRIAIARALVGDPRLLIFDEATSALDTESEAAIQRNMDTMLRGRTTLLIAHRLSTVRRADRILVLDQGTIVESGTHEELVGRGGLYAHLVSQQME